MKTISNKLRSGQRGQAILLIALAMIGLVAFVGLMVDMGILFIEQGKIRRGIDAGAIAAAQQFRKGFVAADLATAAQNFLLLNDTAATQINIYRCKESDPSVADGTIHEQALCTTPLRKLIRVEAQRYVPFSFLRVIGINGTQISSSAVGEAASIDLVLVIDTSASMSYETGGSPDSPDSIEDDPSYCNNPANSTPCQPLGTVKDVALDFLDTMFFPYDRVSVVAMTGQETDGTATRDHVTVLELSDNLNNVKDAINSLKVFQPVVCNWGEPASPGTGPCSNRGDDGLGTFSGLSCPVRQRGADLLSDTVDDLGPDMVLGTADDPNNDPSSCNSSNIGGALLRAGGEFVDSTGHIINQRDEALWIIIMLAGGPANVTNSTDDFAFGYCPSSTWDPRVTPFCRDSLGSTRHGDGNAEYDADDYARDQADFIADPIDGQGVTIFTIGLGRLIRNASATNGDADAAEQLLKYAAEVAGDSPGVTASHGFYSYAPTTAELDAIFTEIANSIFTRITQ